MSTFFDWTSMFGEKLSKGDTNAVLGGKVVGIYFSAHWCGPCRQFTPMLMEFYKEFSAAKNFEIVFASSDRDQAAFDSYFSDMPWSALPFDQRGLKEKLSQKFGVQGIPTLVWIDENGVLLTKNGREKVMTDRSAASFPWRPKTLSQLCTGPLLSKAGSAPDTSFEDLSGKMVWIYFSAHWCPPCKGFTPKLVDYYNNMKKTANGTNFEVVFASSDRSAGEFEEYFGAMPWLALPHGDKRIEELSEHFEVEGIPSLVGLDLATGEVVNKSLRGSVERDPKGSKFPHYPEPVEDLAAGADSSYGYDLNLKPALVLLMEASDDTEQEDGLDALKPHATALAKDKAASADGPEMIFFTNFQQSPLGERLRSVTGLPPAAKSKGPTLILLDIPDKGGYYTRELEGDITEKVIGEYIAQYKSGSLERKQLSKS